MVNVEVYSRATDILGEGPMWATNGHTLYWLDIGAKKLFCQAPSDIHRQSRDLPDYPGCLGSLESGAIAIAMGDGIYHVDIHSGVAGRIYAAPARPAGVRFNDGKVDPIGRFWAGTMQNNFEPREESCSVEQVQGALYRFDLDGRVNTIEEQIGVANTLAWSPDLTLFYFADSSRGQIYVYDFESDSGAIRNRRVFFEGPQYGIPDGSAIDVDGCLWNARWDGSAILRITPEGQVDRAISLPVPRPTSCIFGGPHLETLFITSARDGLTPSQLAESPLSGSVLAMNGLTQGLAVPCLGERKA